MNRLSKLKAISRALSPQKVDFSAFDLELNKLKQSLEETVNIQTVDDVGRQLKQFQKKIDFTPLLTEIEKIRNLFGENTKELERRIMDRTQELMDADEKEDDAEVARLDSEISTLKSQLETLKTNQTSLLQPLNKSVTDIQNAQTLFGSRLTSLSDSLKDFSTKEEVAKAIKDSQDALETLRNDILKKLSSIGGGSMNRQFFVGGADPLTRYTDINLKAGSNITLTYANNNATNKADITIAASGGGGGTVRSITSTSVSSVVGAVAGTDYVVLCNAGVQLSLPTAASNTNLYTIKNVSTSSVLVAPNGVETIDASANLIMPVQYTAVDLISDGTNWNLT